MNIYKPDLTNQAQQSEDLLLIFWDISPHKHLTYILANMVSQCLQEILWCAIKNSQLCKYSGFMQAFLAFSPDFTRNCTYFPWCLPWKLSSYPPNPISKTILFPLTLVSVIRSIIVNWSKQELTANLTAGSKKLQKSMFMKTEKILQHICQYEKQYEGLQHLS